jgi:hypothetical protein
MKQFSLSKIFIRTLVPFSANRSYFLIHLLKILSRTMLLLMIQMLRILMLLTPLLDLFYLLCRMQLQETVRLAKISLQMELRAGHMALFNFLENMTKALDTRQIR